MASSSLYPLYDQHADLWPLVAPLESYEEEMASWTELVREELGSGDLDLLDLGTGGGHHLYHFVVSWPGEVRGTAVDLSPAMLERVRCLLPSLHTVAGDMTSLHLPQTFSLVTVHDSFCYLTDLEQVERLFSTIARHLRPDGLALVKVDALQGEFFGPYRYLTTFEDEEREITLTHYEWDPVDEDGWLEVIYLFLERRGASVQTREERHRLGLFSRAQLRESWRRAGLKGRVVELERWDDERPNPLLVLRRTKGKQGGKGTGSGREYGAKDPLG